MKKLFPLLLLLVSVFTLAACGNTESAAKTEPATQTAESKTVTTPETTEKKTLVAYFSVQGHTKALATEAAKALDADLFEIVPEVPYTDADLNYNDRSTRATVEQHDNASRPAIASRIENFAQYDTVVIAYPIWWGFEPRIVDTFVESYDFAGKDIAVIVTSGSSPVGGAEDVATLAKGSTLKGAERFANGTDSSELKKFFDKIGIGE